MISRGEAKQPEPWANIHGGLLSTARLIGRGTSGGNDMKHGQGLRAGKMC